MTDFDAFTTNLFHSPTFAPWRPRKKASYQKFSDTKPFLLVKIGFEVNALRVEAFRRMHCRFADARYVDEHLSRMGRH